MTRLVDHWLPSPRIWYPYPNQRLIVTTRGKSRMREGVLGDWHSYSEFGGVNDRIGKSSLMAMIRSGRVI